MKRFLTRRNIIIAIILAFIVGGWFWNRARTQKAAAPVLATVMRKDLQQVLVLSGEVKAEHAVTLNFPSPGKLGYINVSEGDNVRAWQALAGLDQHDLQVSVRDYFYRYQAADANAKQIEDEVKGHSADETFVQKNARVSAQASRDIAYDNWLIARKAVSNANLLSPFAGVVTRVTANVVGDTVSVTDGVSVVDPSSLYFETLIDESDLYKINSSNSAQVILDAFPNKKFTVTINTIGFVTQVSSTGATVIPVKLRFAAVDTALLRVGFNGDAEIIYGQASNILTVPVEAVDNNEVKRADGSLVKVETGIASDTEVEIKSGLSEGDKIILP